MTLEIRLLGGFSARRDGCEVPQSDFRGRLTRSLVAVLLTRRGKFVSRDVLVQALWPGATPSDPVNNLNVLVNRARRGLGEPSLILTRPGGYLFALDEGCRVDAEDFLTHVRRGKDHLAGGRAGAAARELIHASELWAEPLAEQAYQEWAQEYRRELGRVHLEALEAGATAALALGDPAHAIALAGRAVAEQPLRESSHLLLVTARAASGDQAGALAAFEVLRHRFTEELGLDPSQPAQELQMRILRGEPPVSYRSGEPCRERPVSHPATEGLLFVGREEEMSRIESAPAQAPVIISGQSGAGKSRLLAEVAARSAVPLANGRAFLPEKQEGWALARTLLREILAVHPGAADDLPHLTAAALIEVLPELTEVRSVPLGEIDASSRRSLATQGALTILAAATREGLAILVDDLQWADPTSLNLLHRAVRKVKGLRILVAYRPDEVQSASPVESFLAVLNASEGACRITLGPLSQAAIVQLVDSRELAKLIVEETDGYPLAVDRAIRAMADQGVLHASRRSRWQAAADFDEELVRRTARGGQQRAMQVRLMRLTADRSGILRLLALAGRELPARVLAQAVGYEEGKVLKELDALSRGALVRLGDQGWATAHDSIAETFAQTMTPEEKAPVHAALAQVLTDPAEVARHLVAAGDQTSAASAYLEAARKALDLYAHQEAQSLAGFGLDLVPTPYVQAALYEVDAEARARQGDVKGAREALRRALGPQDTGPERSRIMTRMAELASGSEDLAEASELVDLALVEAGPDSRTRAEALLVGAVLDLNLGGFERAELRSAEAEALFESSGDSVGIARVLDARAMTAFQGGRIFEAAPAFDRAARLMLDAGQLIRAVTPRAGRAAAMFWMARFEEGLEDAEAALGLSVTLGHPDHEAFSLLVRSCNLGELGMAAAAEADATRAIDIAKSIGHRGWHAFGLWALAAARECQNEPAQGEEIYQEALARSAGMPIFASLAAGKLALLQAVRGEFEGARKSIDQAFAAGGIHGRHFARLARAEIAVANNDPDRWEVINNALLATETEGFLIVAPRLRELAGLL